MLPSETARRSARGSGGTWALPPSPVHPEPLLRVLAHPALDNIRYRLHGAAHIDAALVVAERLHFVADLNAESITRQPDHSRAMDWAFDLACQHRNQRIDLAGAPEERNVDAPCVVLV